MREKKTTKIGPKRRTRFATCFVSETKSFYVVDILPNNRSCKLYFLALINWMSKVKWYIIESSFVKFILAYSTILFLLFTLIQFRFIKKNFFDHSNKREKTKWIQTTNKWECTRVRKKWICSRGGQDINPCAGHDNFSTISFRLASFWVLNSLFLDIPISWSSS